MTVARHESELGRLETACRPASPSLRRYVRSYGGYREETAGPLRRREVPSDQTPLIISFGEPIFVTTSGAGVPPVGYTSFLGGMYDLAAVTEHAGRQHGVQVDLTPFGAYALLGAPLHAYRNTAVELGDLLGDRAEKLTARLAEAVSWDQRFALLDDVLAGWVAAGPAPSPQVAWAWARLRAESGNIAIGQLAEDIGWSRRHLVARFQEQVGLPPKAVARILRFQRALRLLSNPRTGSGARSWADVAAVCGYYDQAHLNRDFRALAGCTPTQYLAAGLPGGIGTSADGTPVS